MDNVANQPKVESMRPIIKVICAAAIATSAIPLQAAVVGYNIGISTFYQFGVPPDLTFADFGTAGPDTGYWRVRNNGTTTFTGTIGQTAVSNFAGDFSYSHSGITLAPGASVVFAVNAESSNVGGFNGAFGSTQPGIQIFLTGLFNATEAVNLSVNDSDIHSGVPQVNPFGLTVDSYVLQGGDPLGRDTGDGFEVAQAAGSFSFIERVANVPEPATLMLAGLGLLGAAACRRRVAH